MEDSHGGNATESKSSSEAPWRSSAAAADFSSGGARKLFVEDQQVKVKRVGLPGYEDAIIQEKNLDGSYSVKYSDGRQDRRVMATRIAMSPSSSLQRDNIQEGKSATEKATDIKYRIGEKVMVNMRGQGRWCPGRIIHFDSITSSVDVRYDDGNEEDGIENRLVKKQSSSEISVPDSNGMGRQSPEKPMNNSAYRDSAISHLLDTDEDQYQIGDKVQGNYRDKGEWYSGEIMLARGNQTFDISYDNGERETRIPQEQIRKKSTSKYSENKNNTTKIKGGLEINGNYPAKASGSQAR